MGSVLREWIGFQQFPPATQSILVELFAKLKEEVQTFYVFAVSIQNICSISSLIVSVFVIIYFVGLSCNCRVSIN